MKRAKRSLGYGIMLEIWIADTNGSSEEQLTACKNYYQYVQVKNRSSIPRGTVFVDCELPDYLRALEFGSNSKASWTASILNVLPSAPHAFDRERLFVLSGPDQERLQVAQAYWTTPRASYQYASNLPWENVVEIV